MMISRTMTSKRKTGERRTRNSRGVPMFDEEEEWEDEESEEEEWGEDDEEY